MIKSLSKFFITKDKKENKTVKNGEKAGIVPDEETFSYISDDPVSDPDLDRFNRWPFSQRVAQTIALRKDPSCIVVGIYGAWGEGKTTVLNFIQKELNRHDNIIMVKFNPWRFGDESQLMRSFFSTLAEALGKNFSTAKEKVGEWIEEYASIVAPLNLQFGVIQASPGEGIKEIGRKLSSATMETLKERIENILRKEKKRVVVLMDDIDRLDKSEIHVLFRLIKLTADFSYTAYVLAFDDDMVAAALGDKYGTGNTDAGKSFLEKIVQVPLHLPFAESSSLREFCYEGIDEAINMANIQLDKQQVQRFSFGFVEGLEIRMNTPRIAKRYCNAVTFALPILKGEVNPVDLLLIEGIRVFYPNLYDTIKDNPDAFLESAERVFNNNQSDTENKRRIAIIDNGIKELNNDEKECAKKLIKSLFPRTDGTIYGSEWDNIWAEEKKIASKQYFYRYFTYAIPKGEISDQKFMTLINDLDTKSFEDVYSEIKHILNRQNADQFIKNLKRREKQLTLEASKKLALILSTFGEIYPNPETLFHLNTYSHAGILISNLIKNISTNDDRIKVAEVILKGAQPIDFATECFSGIRTKDKEKEDRNFTDEELEHLGRILANRIKDYCNENKPIFVTLPRIGAKFFSIWSIWGSKDEVSIYIQDNLRNNMNNVNLFIECYLPTSWGGDGIISKGELMREEYNAISRVVDPEFIYNIIIEVYGEEILQEKDIYYQEIRFKELVAHQFVSIYNYIKQHPQEQTIDQ